MKVFLDANILFSASVQNSQINKLISRIQQYGKCVSSPYAVAEARKNLESKKFGSLDVFESLILEITISKKVVLEIPVLIKPKDIPILGSAVAQKCSHLLTGDKRDFGFLFEKKVLGVKVVSPKLLAEEMKGKGFI